MRYIFVILRDTSKINGIFEINEDSPILIESVHPVYVTKKNIKLFLSFYKIKNLNKQFLLSQRHLYFI